MLKLLLVRRPGHGFQFSSQSGVWSSQCGYGATRCCHLGIVSGEYSSKINSWRIVWSSHSNNQNGPSVNWNWPLRPSMKFILDEYSPKLYLRWNTCGTIAHCWRIILLLCDGDWNHMAQVLRTGNLKHVALNDPNLGFLSSSMNQHVGRMDDSMLKNSDPPWSCIWTINDFSSRSILWREVEKVFHT